MNLSLPWMRLQGESELETRPSAQPVVASNPVEVRDKAWRTVNSLLALALFVGVLVYLSEKVYIWLDQPIQEVRVNSHVRHLDTESLAQTVASGISSSLLSQDVGYLRELALADPWVHSVSVQRQWPAAIEVTIAEEVPVARWGDVGLLNHQGDIFWPERKSDYDSLPKLNGPAHETRAIMQQFHDLNRLFSGYGLKLTGLSLEGRGAWTLELDNGLQIIAGREQVMPRLRRFMKLYDARLSDMVETIEQIDIRYTNGVAVKWRTEERQDNAG